jgi:hypothetical protein
VKSRLKAYVALLSKEASLLSKAGSA